MSIFASNIPVSDTGAIRNQIYNSCAAEAVKSAIYDFTTKAGHTRDVSVYFDYWNGRAIVGNQYIDSGTGAVSNLNNLIAAKTTGYAEKSVWSEDNGHMFMKPSEAAYTNAAEFKLEGYHALNPYVSWGGWSSQINTELMHGKGVILVYDNFEGIAGQHVFYVTGKQTGDSGISEFIDKNSWGTGYGDNGYGTLKYTESLNIKAGYVIDAAGGIDATWTEARGDIALLYAAILGRSGEHDGIVGWVDAIDNGVSMADIANAFVHSPEGELKYGGLTNYEKAGAFYFNATGRVADQAGHDLFTYQLDHNGWTDGYLAEHLIGWIDDGKDTQMANDRLENLETVSMNFGITYQASGEHYGAAVASLVGVTDNADTVITAIIGIQNALGV